MIMKPDNTIQIETALEIVSKLSLIDRQTFIDALLGDCKCGVQLDNNGFCAACDDPNSGTLS